jgi:itaconate CoA-transferase
MRKTVLSKLLVVSLEQAVAAPYCSSRLADAGARVIKIERPDGDFARAYDDVVKGQSSNFVWLNRGKESICLDIKNNNDMSLLMEMIKQADVFIQNLAPGAAKRAGLDSEMLCRQNKKLIAVDISGYGETGPYQNMKAYDLLVQCESGVASITGSPAEPGRVGVSVCDIACGMYAHSAVLEALIERGITGNGKIIKVSLFDAMADWMTVPLLHQEYGDHELPRVGINHPYIMPYGVYSSSDKKSVVVAVQNNREWKSFCDIVLQKPELVKCKLYRDNSSRCANRASLDNYIKEVFGNLPHAQIIHRLTEANVAYGLLNSVKDLSKHEQLRRVQVDTPAGPIQVVAPPVYTPREEVSFGPVPSLNEHGEKIRNEFTSVLRVQI